MLKNMYIKSFKSDKKLFRFCYLKMTQNLDLLCFIFPSRFKFKLKEEVEEHAR